MTTPTDKNEFTGIRSLRSYQRKETSAQPEVKKPSSKTLQLTLPSFLKTTKTSNVVTSSKTGTSSKDTTTKTAARSSSASHTQDFTTPACTSSRSQSTENAASKFNLVTTKLEIPQKILKAIATFSPLATAQIVTFKSPQTSYASASTSSLTDESETSEVIDSSSDEEYKKVEKEVEVSEIKTATVINKLKESTSSLEEVFLKGRSR